MLAPGKIYIGRRVRLEANFSIDEVDVDPTTVTLKTKSPCGTETTYEYDSGDDDSPVAKTSAGDYYCDVTPDEAGRWWYRWETTGTNTADASEGNFLVQTSSFYDDATDYS
jgi:hypothetical protein